MNDKFALQSEQYEFPYHYLVDLESREFVRSLDWGLDYLSYMEKVLELTKKYYRGDVLDVGCGDGYLLYNLARDPEFGSISRAVGIDVDERAVKFAQAFAHGLPVTFKVQDIAAFEERFSLITTVETLEHIPEDILPSFTGHIDRLLQSGGVLVVSVPSNVRPVIEKHYRHYDLEMICEYFPAYQVLETHYVSARTNILYQVIARLLANRRFNLNFGPFKRVLFALHDRLMRDVSAERGAHIVTVLQKP